MPIYAAQVTLAMVSNLAEDNATNTLYCDAQDDVGAGEFVDSIITAYGYAVGLFSDVVRQAGHRVKVYDLSDPKPRAPVTDEAWTLPTAPTGATLPTEVCLCLSFKGPNVSGIPAGRRRGRIYLGPIDAAMSDATGRPTASCINAVKQIGDKLLLDSVALNNYTWVVNSVTAGTSFPVIAGWIDNEFDTQRRRGRNATSRTLFPV